ncbi:hypothetical protein HN51_012851 [Arachis hypogaea]|uniref:Uncharacterized protein n=2 Tax=Arachis TaxID=3817 RepID=A0A445DSM2_ARAHY|nr:uncharacterized protein LOC107480256 [Arachis duranensis]XP_057749220.1 uncharacterized protein LOC130968141 [Arachis stenosperma]QHO58444.1 uncharacterized protein DS421_3g90650 [Arachis hypogaea]RYR66175.1 hypothetical protein Ahy_A03g012137 [Arachis hypogaea]
MEAPMVSIERSSSIEREPRTLSIDQLESARNLAMYILNTKPIEEASRIFTEGLQPVVSAACRMGYTGMDMDPAQELQNMRDDDPAAHDAFRDIASAPF